MREDTKKVGFGYGAKAAPAAFVYGAVTLFRRWLYNWGILSAVSVPLPTISVGGIEVGGSGKTPITGYLIDLLLELNKKPGLLTRGYGRQTKGVIVRERGTVPDPEQIGDEPAMLVTRGLDIPVAACARRLMGAHALGDQDVDVLILDDGFAHRSMSRDLDIVVLRGEYPSGNGHLLPWGSLREPLSSLTRADLLWFHFKEGPIRELPQWVRQRFPQKTVVVSHALPTQPQKSSGEALSLQGDRVIAASGIAFPEHFFDALRGLGAEVVKGLSFRDHHSFSLEDAHFIRQQKLDANANWVVVTPKDWIKLRKWWTWDDLVVVGTEVKVAFGESKLREIVGLESAGA